MPLLPQTHKLLHLLHLYLGISSDAVFSAIYLVYLQNSAHVSSLQGGLP